MAHTNNEVVGVDNTFRRKFDREEYLERARERERQEEARSKSKWVNDFGLLGNWFWRVGSVANQFWGNGVAEILLGVESLVIGLLALGHEYKFLSPSGVNAPGLPENWFWRVGSVASKGPPVQRKPLKHRDFEVDLESRLGKTQVVTPVAPLSQQAGYFCSVCECVVKDSANYLDHINGKKHQRALGMSMRVERASVDQVKQRFEVLKKRRAPGSFTEQDLDERIIKQQQEEEERKRQRREKKKEKKKEKVAEEETEMDPDVAAMMGFGGFGSSKK
uniref:U1-type domain-containing protein n=1 Tax=Fagus sylvatica TaxID=28930 RepID=A0A2N9IW90_FAGSY